MSIRSVSLSPLPAPHIQRSPSHETLSAHPLLSPGPSSPTQFNTSPESSKLASAPKYLPYTPRQRVPTGSATTAATVQSSVSASAQHQQQGSATSKLQLQNLKAAAQNFGLDAGSLGWAMLEELVIGQDHGPAWNEIWNAITVGKATLLLPVEQANLHETITPELMKDHVAFCNGNSRHNAPVVTLSGLRGSIDDHLTIRSTLSPASKSFQALISPSTRSSALLALPPLPIPIGASNTFPEFSVLSFRDSLPVPPRTFVPPKPPLPPRPGAKASTPQGTSRISNPFASLFSKSSTPPSPVPTPTVELPPLDHIVEVTAFIIERPIQRRDVAKAITKAIKSEIKEGLSGVPSWVVDRVQKFSTDLQPFPKVPKKPSDSSKTGQTTVAYDVSPNEDLPEDIARSFQSFYESLEEDMKADNSPTLTRRREDRHNDVDKEKARKEKSKVESDVRVREFMEKVEHTLCSVFYDRLFRPSNSDDASHDEALSSRIAALNILDLDLGHLGVEVGSSGRDVERIIAACGQTISQLEVAQCPSDKAAISVAAHRIIVDGLSKLPPIRLKSDDDVDTEATSHLSSVEEVADNNKANGSLSSVPPKASTTATTPDVPSAPSVPESHTNGSTADLILPDPVSLGIGSHSREPAVLTISPPPTPTPVSGDILLPLIIFSVVKSNPSQLVSHLLYTQRYRNQSVGGEESYCIINLMAVVEFLENVDLGALGLKDSEKKVMSTADLTPIPLAQAAFGNEKDSAPQGTPAGLRGRVEQQVDAIAGSANKVISGVVDSSFGVLRALLPANADQAASSDGADSAPPRNSIRPGFGLLRRESGFSIASFAASLPGARDRAKSFHSHKGEDGQEMVESRPGSIKSVFLEDSDSNSGHSDESGSSSGSEEEDEEAPAHDAKSIRSFESMMSGRSRRREGRRDRLSLTDRLANMSRLTRVAHSPSAAEPLHDGSPPPRRTSLLAPDSFPSANRLDTPLSSREPSPAPPADARAKIPRPNTRFLDCPIDDLKVSEVPELLLEYRRLVESVRTIGAFDE